MRAACHCGGLPGVVGKIIDQSMWDNWSVIVSFITNDNGNDGNDGNGNDAVCRSEVLDTNVAILMHDQQWYPDPISVTGT